MDLRDRYVITPKGSSGTLWVHLSWEGKKPGFPHLLPDGKDYGEVIVEQGLNALPEDLWLEPWRSGRLVDWLWSGLSERVFSQRMVDVLTACGVNEMEVRPLTIRRKRSPDIEGYSIARFPGEGERVGYFPPSNPSAWSLIVAEDIAKSLAENKLTGFTIQPAQQAWDETYGKE
ncbi:hypothetical protein ACFPGO_05790 [Arcanobacterium canis]|uniref:FAD dependent oxidoreductase n=1 Tax=Arcanobacterium canis TaxID=999183 RepID=A0ABY8FYV2_9ACTO|nr:hypothetical protein [Arcanobacterium canis]WFM83710.1 hypothetical protein P7079_01640 [Arcanobacterium canis]